jgi:hypothetical protein
MEKTPQNGSNFLIMKYLARSDPWIPRIPGFPTGFPGSKNSFGRVQEFV